MALAADWLESTIALIRQAWQQAPPSRSARRVATVEPWHDESGWYQVRGRLWPNVLEFIAEGSLAYGSGERAIAFDVLEVVIDGEQVRVRVSGAAPRARLSLLVRDTSTRQVLEGLGKGLAASSANPLLRQFGERRLTPIQLGPWQAEDFGPQGPRPAQRVAIAACCSPGLQLVWGPPGTGKTYIIATAIRHLAASGQRVLLVSSNNIAVDTALQQAVPIQGANGEHGAIRIGNIALPELTDEVRLDRLVETRQREQQARIDALAGQLEELARAGRHLADAQDLLADFDPDAYEQAALRVDNRLRWGKATAAQGPAKIRLRQAQEELRLCEQQLLSLACCEAADHEAEIRNGLETVDAALAAYQESSRLSRARHPGMKSKLAVNRTSLLNELASAAAARRQAVRAASLAGADPTPPNRPDVAQTAAAAERARRDFSQARAELERLQEEADRVERAGLADEADGSLIAAERQRWVLHESLPDLRKGADEALRRRSVVQREYDEASERLRRNRRETEREIVSGARVVATTLTQLTLRTWITQTRFDHVIVDEAAAVSLPHLAHAIGYARTGAVLVGDYLQNGPIVDKSFPGGKEVRELFEDNCFSFFDATTPRQAQQMAGCVVLTEQFRFGPALTELANLVAYDGILTTGATGTADIVVITVDGLPEDIRTIHRERKQAGWWLIGALLARALAEHHYDGGRRDAFGVVVPYVAQEEITQAALDDSSLARTTPAGTSHKFQGRQFETVLADLVEDGNGRMVTADLRADSYDAESVRLFNVAATRARSRLYVLVGRRPLERARNGPLAALRTMVSNGRACRIDADSLLGMFGAETPAPGSPEADLVAALDPYVRIAGIHDEDAAIDEVIARVDEARSSIWCWSAWVGRHADGITDALCRAHERGVLVHVMARPEAEVQGANRVSLRTLATRLPRVVLMRRMHQKIVVVDQQWSIVGSMNMLSYGRTSASRIRDVMFTMDGARFAERLLRQELAEELGQQRHCSTCSQAMTECGLVGSGSARGWAWICSADPSHRLAFPGASAGANKRRNASSHS